MLRVAPFGWLLVVALVLVGCERGDASRNSCDPASPGSCPEGFLCRGGVCIRFSTPIEPPTDPVPPPAPPPPAAPDAGAEDLDGGAMTDGAATDVASSDGGTG